MPFYLLPLTANADNGNVGGTLITQVVILGAVALFMYFVLIRPQKKKEKEVQDMRGTVQIGDEITTVGGIVGIVVKKGEDTVVIETGGDRSKLRIKLWAIQENATAAEAARKPKKENKSEEKNNKDSKDSKDSKEKK